MGRYDRNRNKKSDRSTFFIMPLILALLIGLAGSLFSVKLFKKKNGLNSLTTLLEETDESSQQGKHTDQLSDANTDAGKLLVNSAGSMLNEANFDPKSGLPALLDSDGFIRKQLAKLSPGLAPWLNTDQVIRRYLTVVNDFAQGLRVSKHMSFLRFDEPFAATGDGNVLYIAPKSFSRYSNLATTIQAIDAKSAAQLYIAIRPLLIQVFAEFGYPKDITLESIVKKAAGEIIATPVIQGEIELVRPSLFYKFADPNLESLNAVQKQIIRMGPENQRILQQKCREFLVELAKKTG